MKVTFQIELNDHSFSGDPAFKASFLKNPTREIISIIKETVADMENHDCAFGLMRDVNEVVVGFFDCIIDISEEEKVGFEINPVLTDPPSEVHVRTQEESQR